MGCRISIKQKIGIDVDTTRKEDLKDKEILLNIDGTKWKEKPYKNYFKTILLFITNRCNLNCANCFDRANVHGLEEMNFEYIKTIIDSNPQVKKYDIMGGEPLLHGELDKILKYLAKKNKKIGLYTNGLLLDNFRDDYKNLRLNMAFHTIKSKNNSLKPIAGICGLIKKFQYIYPLKIVFLMTEENKYFLPDFAEYVERNFKNISKLTIGLVRNEEDYYNDEYEGIVSLKEYAKIVQKFMDIYEGNFDVDIFAEGLFYTKKLPRSSKNQINRFKCVFVNNKYTCCLYDVGSDKKILFDPQKPIVYSDYRLCPRTGKDRCLTDKIKLQKINKS